MKQLIIMNRQLKVKYIIVVDNIIPVEDIISPQKTTFETTIDNKDIVIGDLIVLRNETNIEYLGVVQDLETDTTSKIASFPLINITDTDCIMNNISGNVFDWIKTILTANFVETADELLKLPFSFKNSAGVVDLTLEVGDGNLFDVLLDIFKKTGVYLDFSLEFEEHKPKNILVDVRKASDNNQFIIRYDNPILFEKPTIEQSQAQSVNKIIFRPSTSNKTHKDSYIFYLLDNDKVIDSSELKNGDNESHRINGVVQQIQQYTDNDYANLKKKAEEEMLGDVLNHQITLKVMNNASFDFKLYNRVRFIDEKIINGQNRVFETYITRIENNNDIYKVIRLGVLRTTLTDKIKALQKAVLNTQISTYTGGGSSGGGGSGTTNYNDLTNKPRLNTTNTSSLEPNVETLSGDVNLHKVAKTGKMSDLNNDADYVKQNELPNKLPNPKPLNIIVDGDATQYDGSVEKNITINSGGGGSSGSSGGLPLGTIVSRAVMYTDSSLYALDGTTISQNGIYSQFCTWLKNLVAQNPTAVPTCTQEEFDATVAEYHQCGKFVIDDTAGTIRVPKITRFIEGVTDISSLGEVLKAGLPNISGSIFSRAGGNYNGAIVEADGAFDYELKAGGSYSQVEIGSEDYQQSRTRFNASWSNPIYGRTTASG